MTFGFATVGLATVVFTLLLDLLASEMNFAKSTTAVSSLNLDLLANIFDTHLFQNHKRYIRFGGRTTIQYRFFIRFFKF